jgi:PIN domain nuclease of toxin-antitoxin system
VNAPPLLDTHAWLWWLLGDPRLPAAEARALNALPPGQRPWLSDISLWETALLVERKRVALSMPLREWLEIAAGPASVRVLPITPAVAAEVAHLPDSFHRDPADRVIVATARVLDLPLASHDRLIRGARLCPMWRPV